MDELKTIQVDTQFGSFMCCENDHITGHLQNFGAHTRNELVMVLDHIRVDDIVLDIGSHIGTYSIPIAKKLSKGKGHIYCIEGSLKSYKLLKQNIVLNNLNSYATCDNIVISDNEQLKYSLQENVNNTGANYYVEKESLGEVHTVSTLKNYLVDKGVMRVDFIKIDVEGMEFRILNSIKHEIREYRPILYIEISRSQLGRHNNTPYDIELILSDLNYSFYMNTYKRNSNEDFYAKSQIRDLSVRHFFDVLAIPNNRT